VPEYDGYTKAIQFTSIYPKRNFECLIDHITAATKKVFKNLASLLIKAILDCFLWDLNYFLVAWLISMIFLPDSLLSRFPNP